MTYNDAREYHHRLMWSDYTRRVYQDRTSTHDEWLTAHELSRRRVNQIPNWPIPSIDLNQAQYRNEVRMDHESAYHYDGMQLWERFTDAGVTGENDINRPTHDGTPLTDVLIRQRYVALHTGHRRDESTDEVTEYRRAVCDRLHGDVLRCLLMGQIPIRISTFNEVFIRPMEQHHIGRLLYNLEPRYDDLMKAPLHERRFVFVDDGVSTIMSTA